MLLEPSAIAGGGGGRTSMDESSVSSVLGPSWVSELVTGGGGALCLEAALHGFLLCLARAARCFVVRDLFVLSENLWALRPVRETAGAGAVISALNSGRTSRDDRLISPACALLADGAGATGSCFRLGADDDFGPGACDFARLALRDDVCFGDAALRAAPVVDPGGLRASSFVCMVF